MREIVAWADILKLKLGPVGPDLNPNHSDSETQVTTLHRAAFSGSPDVIRWCVAKGASLTARSTIGRTPLHFACDGNLPENVRLLIEMRADVNELTLSGSTPLHLCCVSSSVAALQVLLSSGEIVELDVEDTRRRTAEMFTSGDAAEAILEEIAVYRKRLNGMRRKKHAMDLTMHAIADKDQELLQQCMITWCAEVKVLAGQEAGAIGDAAKEASTGVTEDVNAAKKSKAAYAPPYMLEMPEQDDY